MAKLLCSIIFACALSSSSASSSAESERPHIVVHKDLQASSPGFLVKGQTFKAVYTVSPASSFSPSTSSPMMVGSFYGCRRIVSQVLNLGLGDALDVRVKDDWTASSFEVVSGKASATWAKLEGCVILRSVDLGGLAANAGLRFIRLSRAAETMLHFLLNFGPRCLAQCPQRVHL